MFLLLLKLPKFKTAKRLGSVDVGAKNAKKTMPYAFHGTG
jgi:hypothetical protein